MLYKYTNVSFVLLQVLSQSGMTHSFSQFCSCQLIRINQFFLFLHTTLFCELLHTTLFCRRPWFVIKVAALRHSGQTTFIKRRRSISASLVLLYQKRANVTLEIIHRNSVCFILKKYIRLTLRLVSQLQSLPSLLLSHRSPQSDIAEVSPSTSLFPNS